MKISWFKLLDGDEEYLIHDLLHVLIYWGEQDFYYTFLIYLKQGYKCKDCDEEYWECECNSKFNIANLEKRDIKNLILKWCEKNLSKRLIQRLLNSFDEDIYPNHVDQNIKKLLNMIKINK